MAAPLSIWKCSNPWVADEIAKTDRDWIICCYFTSTVLYILTIIGLILVATFFVTSADSATFVVSTQTSNGSLSPKNSLKLIWGLTIAIIAAILLQAGGLNALQIAAIIAALPFSIVVVLMVTSLFKELRKEDINSQTKEVPKK